MRRIAPLVLGSLIPLVAAAVFAAEDQANDLPPSMAEVLESSQPSDWLRLDPAESLYVQLPSGRVVIRLAPEFAPRHVENIKALVAERFFDGLSVVRSQENYVVQWGDPVEEPDQRRQVKKAQAKLQPEFDRALEGLEPTLLPDGDVYAPSVGFSAGFPVALDPQAGRAWLAHCHAMVGVGRDVDPASGNGGEIYVVIGHSPRHLDLNVTLVGRVVEGMELLSTMPRGTGPLGFYETAEERIPILSIRMGTELPEDERANVEFLRTDTATFEALVVSRRNRHESWFASPSGRIGLCNVPLPVRRAITE